MIFKIILSILFLSKISLGLHSYIGYILSNPDSSYSSTFLAKADFKSKTRVFKYHTTVSLLAGGDRKELEAGVGFDIYIFEALEFFIQPFGDIEALVTAGQRDKRLMGTPGGIIGIGLDLVFSEKFSSSLLIQRHILGIDEGLRVLAGISYRP